MEDLCALRPGDQIRGFSEREARAVPQLYRFAQDPEISVRSAVLNGETIQRFAAVMEELRAWEALPQQA